MYGGTTKVEGCRREEWRREEWEEEFEEAMATEFGEVVKIINGAGPLRSRRERCRGYLEEITPLLYKPLNCIALQGWA